MPFKLLEDTAIADIAFEATGKTLEEVFESAALAFSDISVDLNTVEGSLCKEIKLENEDPEKLLFDFLNQLVLLKDSQLLFNEFHVTIKKNQKYELMVEACGEMINPEKQKLRDDIKAVTMHNFELKQTSNGWRAQVVVDI